MASAMKLLCLLMVAAYSSALPTAASPPEIKEGPMDVNNVAVWVEGSEVVIRCRVFGAAQPIFKWMRNGVEVTGGKFNITAEGDLVIRNVGYEDAGLYRCYVQNSLGNASAYTLLDIRRRTIITSKPVDVEVAAGSMAVFHCLFDSDPGISATIIWEFEGVTIVAEGHFTIAYESDDYPLLISNTVPEDAGTYTCVVRTPVDEARAQATLTVKASPPEIKEGPKNVTKVDGSEVVMRCRVYGAPRPIVKWMRNDVELTGGKFNITAESDLVIRNVGYEDAGLYRCYVQNSLGNASADGFLDIKRRTIITNKPMSVEVLAGTKAVFLCSCDSDPDLTPTVTWEFEGETIATGGHFAIANDYRLLINGTGMEDAGTYTCVVRTPIDEARAQATLTVTA